ncbi:hypothetical protein JIR001_13900 [Polycladomyces abyssicola]|uniref:Uncharacterized protein n=1 Tax=Polycladomyces abyssicola TaxID=1125966 RepID=A0A8D5UGL8_9BACL|nr:hypothetical protein JIR001_13900 [Polycladomyces abyssicola]
MRGYYRWRVSKRPVLFFIIKGKVWLCFEPKAGMTLGNVEKLLDTIKEADRGTLP